MALKRNARAQSRKVATFDGDSDRGSGRLMVGQGRRGV
jgi:hypothetical protein